MMYTLHYDSPLGGILLAADEVGLTGLWFDGEKYFADTLDPEHIRSPPRIAGCSTLFPEHTRSL